MDRRLAAYQGVETDPAIVAEMERIIRSGLVEQEQLPVVPPPARADPAAGPAPTRGRRPNPRRGR